jgi:hypothetical protein
VREKLADLAAVMSTSSQGGCMTLNSAAKSGLSGDEAQLRTQVMRAACTQCVDQGKTSALHEEGKTISSCH